MRAALDEAATALAAASPLAPALAARVVEASRDLLSPYLDARDGATVTDHSIFRKLSAYWEEDFLKDMDDLNVRRPDILTRVSEYIPEIVTYTEQIIKNGFGCAAFFSLACRRPSVRRPSLTDVAIAIARFQAPPRRDRYESSGSVYFDARKFDDHPDHHYAKLEPRSAFNVQLVEEGEGPAPPSSADRAVRRTWG